MLEFQTFFNIKIINNIEMHLIAIHVYVITATILVANLSYNYVEKPFLKLKNKFAIVRSQTSIKK